MKQHSSRFLNIVTETKKVIKEVTPQKLKEWLDLGEDLTIIDVREKDELNSGIIPTAIHLSKGVIERDIEKKIADINTKIVVYCSGGFRCALVAQNLQNMGYTNVYSLDSGVQGWIAAGYPLTTANE